MSDVLIFGDSHTAALRRGQVAIETDGQWPEAIRLTIRPLGGGHLSREPFFVDRGDHAEITLPEYRRQFDRLPRIEDGPTTWYGVSAPLHSVRLWRHPAWQSFAPADGVSRGAATPVSSGMIRRLALDDQAHMLTLLDLLKRAGRQVFVIEAPRPFRQHPALRKTSAEVVSRVDRLYRDAVRGELRRLGVPIVDVPQRCLDGEFMCADLGKVGDPHHGNETYGRIMMEIVLAYLSSSQGSSSSESAAL